MQAEYWVRLHLDNFPVVVQPAAQEWEVTSVSQRSGLTGWTPADDISKQPYNSRIERGLSILLFGGE